MTEPIAVECTMEMLQIAEMNIDDRERYRIPVGLGVGDGLLVCTYHAIGEYPKAYCTHYPTTQPEDLKLYAKPQAEFDFYYAQQFFMAQYGIDTALRDIVWL